MKILSYPKKLQIKNFINKGLLIFDLDGTIIDSKKDIINSFNFAFKKNNLKLINEAFFLKNASRGSDYFIKKNFKKKNIKRSFIDKINRDFISHYYKNCTKNTTCKKGLKIFLKKTKKNYVNIITTNKKKKIAEKICKKLNIFSYFDQIFGSDTLLNKKPSKKHLDEILKKYNFKKSKILIFGDSEVDYNFAKYSSENFILIKDGYTIKKTEKIIQKYSINNFYELKNILDLFKF